LPVTTVATTTFEEVPGVRASVAVRVPVPTFVTAPVAYEKTVDGIDKPPPSRVNALIITDEVQPVFEPRVSVTVTGDRKLLAKVEGKETFVPRSSAPGAEIVRDAGAILEVTVIVKAVEAP